MILQTQRLLLRPIQLDDKQTLFDYRKDEETNKYQGWIPKTIGDVEEFIGKLEPQLNIPKSWFQMAIIEKENQVFIGDLGIHFLEESSQQVELGYTLNKKFQGKGYATEAINTVINYLFSELNKHRITTSVDPENSPSFKLLERLGFIKEAHFRESLFINDEWVDDIIYALLAKEWKPVN